MNLRFHLPANFKESLVRGHFDFDAAGGFTAYLMRPGYVFNANAVETSENFQASVPSHQFTLTADATGKNATIVQYDATPNDPPAYPYNTEGLIVGSHISIDDGSTAPATNKGVYVVRSVAPHTLRVAWVSGDLLVTVTDVTGTIACEDEHATVSGQYTRGTGVPVDFDVSGTTITLDTMCLVNVDSAAANHGIFGTAIGDSPGFIICDDTAPESVVAYCEFEAWELPY